MDKMKRSEFVTFLDVTPSASEMTLEKLGIGITDMAISYGPNVDTEKWVIEDTARHDHTSNEKTMGVSQSIYKDDPCYNFVEKGLDKMNYVTHIVDVNRAKEISEGVYAAKLSDGKVVINNYMGENAVIDYDLYYEGDPVEGSVTFEGGKAKFTPNGNVD